MHRLLVIGGASSDILHLADRTVACAGGAGMYTAMAAHRCGIQVALFAPHPQPVPEPLLPLARRLAEWLGPVVPPEQLPQFEISYRGPHTEYLNMSFGAEADLSPAMLPADLSKYDLIHLTPIGDAHRQLAFLQACRQQGARRLSAGSGANIAAEQPSLLRALSQEVDYLFLNEAEARAVYGSPESASVTPGKVLFITRGALGASIIQGDTATWLSAQPTAELDPTGAGDTFCGATLAYLLQGAHPLLAARRATPLAAETIAQIGPAALLSDEPPPEIPLDPRVAVNMDRVRKVAQKIATLAEVSPFPFVSPQLPPAGHPQALDYFFAATLQQFSFWSERDGHYHRPLIANIGGASLKGADYLFEAFRRRQELDPAFCSPERQANLSREELLDVFRADDGRDPMPALDLHLEQARSYGRDMLARQLTPSRILRSALASAAPLSTFLQHLDHVGGYKEDPLRKKSTLLAVILNQRPERFLPLRDEQPAPVIDYHLMRSCLRVGLVDVLDQELADKLRRRQVVSAAEEWAVRYPAYRAIERVIALSGKSAGAVDWFFFGARKRCPEMSEPECERCQIDPVCAHRKALFQPVIRTPFY